MHKNNKKALIIKMMDRVDLIVNFSCVVFLTLQVISIISMVVGRYFFNHVPKGIEEFALFCMVWISLLSISLSIRDDSHIKMEIVDAIVSPDKVKYFQYFAAVANIIFSVYMIFYGIELVQLTAGTSMPTFRISEGFLYLAIPVAGLFMAIASVGLIIEKIGGDHNVS